MKSGYLGTLAMLFLGAGWAAAQGPAPPPSAAPTAAPPGVVMPSAATMQPAVTSGPPVMPTDGVVTGGPVWYATADYLLWKTKEGTLPSTVRATPFGAIPITVQNTLVPVAGGPSTPFGSPVSQMIPASAGSEATFGNGGRTNTGYQNGGRFTVGWWVDPEMDCGVEVGFLFLESVNDFFNVNTSGTNGIFNAQTGTSQTIFINSTTIVNGVPIITQTPQSTINVLLAGNVNGQVKGAASTSLYGGEINARGVFLRIGGTDVGGLAGFRFLTFKDELRITDSILLTGLMLNTNPPQNQGDMSFSSVDNTRVYNYFYGGQVGLDIDSKFGDFFVYARGKIAVGTNHQVADVNSNGLTTMNGVTTSTGGGLLATSADNGRHTRDQLSYVPEVDVKVGYQFLSWLRGYVGYGGVYLGSFARAGTSTTLNTFNANVNINNAATNLNVAQPNFQFTNHNVYIQGVTFGLEARY